MLTCWILVPLALRLQHTSHNPRVEKRERYFRGQIVCLASHRDKFPLLYVSGGGKSSLSVKQSLARGYRMSSEIHIIFLAPYNIALMLGWENAAWMQELAQLRPSLSPGHGFQGFQQMRAEGPEDLLEPSTSQFLCVCVRACRQTCLIIFPTCEENVVEGCTVGKELEWDCALVWQTWVGESGSNIKFKRLLKTSNKNILTYCMSLFWCAYPNTSAITYTQLWWLIPFSTQHWTYHTIFWS